MNFSAGEMMDVCQELEVEGVQKETNTAFKRLGIVLELKKDRLSETERRRAEELYNTRKANAAALLERRRGATRMSSLPNDGGP